MEDWGGEDGGMVGLLWDGVWSVWRSWKELGLVGHMGGVGGNRNMFVCTSALCITETFMSLSPCLQCQTQCCVSVFQ